MKDKLYTLGFREDPSNPNILHVVVNNYTIKIHLDINDIISSKIDYGHKIKVHHNGISNLTKGENLVQLECVLRLLKKGYSPQNLELEKTYKLGHNQKGRLDICINNKNESWALIECKTYGKEYETEKSNLVTDGGQIFSYYAQDRSARVIGIYSSTINNSTIEYKTHQVFTYGLNISSDLTKIHDSWDKQLINNGVMPPFLSTFKSRGLGNFSQFLFRCYAT